MNTAPKVRDLVVTRLIDAPVEQVWQAWTDPELVKQWWGPDYFTCPFARIDFRVGGTSLVCMSSPQFGDQYSTWHYKEIVPLQRIDYIHNLADKNGDKIDPTSVGMPPDFPQDLLNSVTFKALGAGKTEMTVTEYGWTEGRMMELSQMGLEQCLDKMAVIFA
jgi:uncharacterized protein YndB with AHSA1/START domain